MEANISAIGGTVWRARWLRLAHVTWIVCAVCALLIFLAALPLGYAVRLNSAPLEPLIDAPAWYVAAVNMTAGQSCA